MSAQVIAFPANVRQLHAIRRAVRDSIATRANEVGATMEQKLGALAAAFEVMASGGSAGWAIAVGKDMLPRPKVLAYRQPTPPFPPAAA